MDPAAAARPGHTYDLGYKDATTGEPISDQDAGARPLTTAASEGERIDAACRAMVGAAAQPTAAARESVQHDCAELGHRYDDDWPWPDQADMRALAPGSRVGDPCIWCDHDKGADVLHGRKR